MATQIKLAQLIQDGATDGQVITWNDIAEKWEAASAGSGGITTLNTLTAATQTFAAGTSGTDFAINSSTSTHTFNLPTASGSARGALSSTDWTTFNNKQNAISWNNVTAASSKITLGGTPTGSVFSAFSIDVNEGNLTLNNIGGTLGETKGGTNQTTYAQGDILYASGVNTLAKLPKNTTSTRYLSNTGASNNPAWAAIDLSNGVTGRLPYANVVEMGSDRLLGRDTPGDGNAEVLTVGGGIEFTGTGGIQTSAFTGDATKSAGSTSLTLATVNSNIGSFGSATQVGTFTVNGKGLITAASNATIAIPSTAVTDFTEAVQDVVGNASFLSDTDTVDWTYDDVANTLSGAVKTQMSVTSDASGIRLVSDAATPGNSKYYGTNGGGTKGFFDLPAASLTANNGINIDATVIQLGGALTEVTTITGDTTNFLTINGTRTGPSDPSLLVNNTSGTGPALRGTASGSGTGVWGTTSSGVGTYGAASTGIGVSSYSNGTVGMNSALENESADSVATTLRLDRQVSSAGAAGIGSRILFTHKTSTTGTVAANTLESIWSTATHASRLSQFRITGYNVAVENALLTLSGTGAARLNQYGTGTFTGTAAYNLQVDASGNIIETAVPSSGVSDGDYGDITVSSGGTVWTIDNNAVTDAKINDVSVAKLTSGTLVSGITFTTPAAATTTFNYATGAAIEIADALNAVYITSKNGSNQVSIDNTSVIIGTGAVYMEYVGGVLRLYDSDGSHYIGLQTPATANLTTSYTLTLPTTDGNANQVLTTDGAGVLSWTTPVVASGDVVGPASSVANRIATFSGTTGKIIQDSGKLLPSGTVIGTTDTQTLTAKRIDPRVTSAASQASPTPDISTTDVYILTAQAATAAFQNPTGTPVQGNRLLIRIKDNGTTRSITWGTQYRALGVALPTATVASKTLYIGLIYNSTDTKWDCIAVAQEG